MSALKQAATDFLAHRRIAVAGVSRDPRGTANAICRSLRHAGYEVFAVNPNADEIEGERCYRSLAAIPGGVEGVVVVTHPSAAAGVVRECAALGIARVWLHHGPGPTRASPEAIAECERAGIALIEGGCPLMFLEHADLGHRCMRWFFGVTGKLPDGGRYHTGAQESAGV